MSIFGGGINDITASIGIDGLENFKKDMSEADRKVLESSQKMQQSLNAVALVGVAAFALSIKAASDFESSFAGIVKTTDGLSDEFGNLNEEGRIMADRFRELALTIPMSVNELNKIGELGGQLGIPRQELDKFTDTIARLGVSSNLTFEQGATELARFVNITKQVAPEGMTASEQIERIAATIVDLGNNFATSEAEISSFGQRLAGAGAQMGLSQSDILAIGAALSSVGVNAEAGGTAFSKVMSKMTIAAATGNGALEKFAQVAGVSIDQFKTMIETDGAKAITSFVTGLGRMSSSGENVYGVLDSLDMADIRVTDSLLRASGASDLFNAAVERGSIAFEKNTALVDESNKRFNTYESQMILLKNAFNDALIAIGQKFLPVLKTLNQFFINNKGSLVTFVTAIGTLLVLAGTLAIFYKGWIAWNALLQLSWGTTGLIIAGIVLAVTLLYTVWTNNVGGIKDFTIEVFGKIMDAFKVIWDYIKEWANAFTTFWVGIYDIIKGIFTFDIELIKKGFGKVFDAISFVFGEIWTAWSGLWTIVINSLVGIVDGIGQGIGLAITAVVGVFNTIWDFLSGWLTKVGTYLSGLGTLMIGVFTLDIEKIKTGFNQVKTAATDIWDSTLGKLETLTDTSTGNMVQTFTSMVDKSVENFDTEGKWKPAFDQVGGLWDVTASGMVTTAEGTQTAVTGELGKIDMKTAAEEKMKLLKDAGITTTDMVKAQIGEWENYRLLVGDDQFAIKKIDAKILELNKSLIDSGIYTDAWKLSVDNLGGDLDTGLNPKLNDTIGHMQAGIKTFPEVKGGLDNISDGIKAKIGNWIEFSGLIGEVVDKMNLTGDAGIIVKTGLNIFGTALGQLKELGIDPTKASLTTMLDSLDWTSIGFMALGAVINILAGKGGTVQMANREISEMKDTLGAMYEPTMNLKKALESLDGELDSNLIDSLLKTQEQLADMLDYMIRLPGNIAESSEMYKRMTEQLKMTNEEIERLTAPFTQMTEYDKGIETLGYLIGEYQKFIALFGENQDTSAIEVLVREQINKLEILRKGLDPTSEAYKELTRQIENADAILAGITPTIDDNVEATEKGVEVVKTWNQVWQDFARTFDEQLSGQFSEFDEFLSSADQAKDLMSRLTYFKVDLDTTGADEAIYKLMQQWAAYLQTLDRNSPAFREGLAAFQELRQQYNGLSAGSADAGSQANEFGQDVQGMVSPTNDAADATDNLTTVVAEITPEVKAQAEATQSLVDAMHEQNYEVNKLNLNYKDLDTYFGNVTGQFDEYLDSLGKFGKEGFEGTGELFGILDRLEQFNINFADTNVDEQLGQYILQVQAFLDTLDPNSEAYRQLSTGLDSFIRQFEEMGGVIPDASDAAEDMSGVLEDYADDLEAAAGATMDPPISDAFVQQTDNTLTYLRNEYDKFVGDSVSPAKTAIEDSFGIFNPASIEALEIKDGMDDIVGQFGLISDSITVVNDYLDAMRDKILGMPIIPTTPTEGGGTLHTGGFPKAHSGYMSRGDEVWIKALKDEMILGSHITQEYGKFKLKEFNRTGDSSVLGGSQRGAQASNINVVIHNANPQTWAEITQDSIYPNIKNKQRNFETEGNPYK